MARVIRKKVLTEESTSPQVEVAAPRQRIGKPSPANSVMGFLLCLALGTAGYFYYQYKNTAEVAQKEEIEKLVSIVGASMELPTGEFPTLATVTNKEKLDNQPFFKRAENGDKILIYSNSGRAILYRPSSKKIVDVTTVNIETEEAAPVLETPPVTPEVSAPDPMLTPLEGETVQGANTETQTPGEAVVLPAPTTPKVALYNGSTTVGVTGKVETTLTTTYPNVIVVVKEKAVKNDYSQTIVVDVTGSNTELAGNMAATLGGIVAGIPSGEVAWPEADIVVIVGNQ